MKYTANYNLKKPEGTDVINIDDLNDNADIIDSELKKLNTNKVDKVSGKGLSTNDFTTTEKNKLAGIEEGANKTTINNTLTSTSTVQALSAKQGKTLKDELDEHLADYVQLKDKVDNLVVTGSFTVATDEIKTINIGREMVYLRAICTVTGNTSDPIFIEWFNSAANRNFSLAGSLPDAPVKVSSDKKQFTLDNSVVKKKNVVYVAIVK